MGNPSQISPNQAQYRSDLHRGPAAPAIWGVSMHASPRGGSRASADVSSIALAALSTERVPNDLSYGLQCHIAFMAHAVSLMQGRPLYGTEGRHMLAVEPLDSPRSHW